MHGVVNPKFHLPAEPAAFVFAIFYFQSPGYYVYHDLKNIVKEYKTLFLKWPALTNLTK